MALPVSDTRNVEDLTFTLSHNMPNKNAGHELLPMSDQYYFDALFWGVMPTLPFMVTRTK